MSTLPVSAVSWLLIAVQAMGIASAGLARLSVGSSRQALFQWMFILLLGFVAAATGVAAVSGPHNWLMSGATLAVMIMMVVCDFRQSQSPSEA
jgi:hypothetical protein